MHRYNYHDLYSWPSANEEVMFKSWFEPNYHKGAKAMSSFKRNNIKTDPKLVHPKFDSLAYGQTFRFIDANDSSNVYMKITGDGYAKDIAVYLRNGEVFPFEPNKVVELVSSVTID